ncbi:MAG: 23S rRNA (guanosine(2251)-2'-O)-methyltransferase RlmB [Anaerolineae bacterium]|nr:23S rRNA (guanosine(2251)-2'-O)-methyltransferase RlmB [Anaerolineae bacterium]
MREYLIRRNTVWEALRGSRRELHCLWLQQGLEEKVSRPYQTAAHTRYLPIRIADKNHLTKLAGDSSHQGMVLEVGPYQYSDLDDILALAAQRHEKPFLLLLDLLHGPQNIGQLLRTAEVVGVHGVVLQDRRAPDITPTVAQFSAGATEHLLLAQVTNLVQAIKRLQAEGIWIVGLDLDEGSQLLPEVDLNMPLGIVVGNEGEGMRRLVRQNCDIRLKLPQKGQVDSLNAAIAGSILLYQAWQARKFS